ncbi:MAG: ankyrin repeat domain-containing protein [Deltaproteobacteria bacterium]|nr:ankyrin repeat domain-containing protein [Deltaproteobacteria bacterium]
MKKAERIPSGVELASDGHPTKLDMVFLTVSLLIDKGASLSLKSGNGLTPLHYAVVGGHERMIVLLLKKGARVDVLDSQGRTPLQLAKIYNSESAMELLADPEKAKQKVFKPRKHKHKHHDHEPEDNADEPEKEKAAEPEKEKAAGD